MIGLYDSFTLVRAKLHSKRLLLISTIIISGLLFAVLYAAIIVFSGVTKSANEYTQTALGGKYLVKSTPVIPPSVFGPNIVDLSETVITELTTMQTNYIASQKALATQLKLPFDATTIEPILLPNPYADKSLPEKQRVRINIASPIYQQYLLKLQQDYAKVAKNKLSDLQATAKAYDATAYHINTPATVSFQDTSYLKGGKEDVSSIGKGIPTNSDQSTDGYMTASARNSTYSFVDDSLIQRFILPPNGLRKSHSSAIPVVITAKEAIDLFGPQLGLGSKPDKASDQIAWMKILQQKVNGITYSACYRNQADSSAIVNAAQTLSAIEENKNDKTYVMPSLIYTLPTVPCGEPTIKTDTRTVAERNAAASQDDISKKLGTYQTPIHQLMTFQVVGVMSTAPQEASLTSLPSFLTELLGAQYGIGAIIPSQMYAALPSTAQHKDILQNDTTNGFNINVLQKAGINETIVTFNTLGKARAFIKEQGCLMADGCKKQFALVPYGTNYLLMDDLQIVITTILRYALVGVVSVAIIIIWFMMTRVIIDSRRETAVFRAIGAKRKDISTIYLLYSLSVATRIAVFSIVIGTGIAVFVQTMFSTEVTDYALVSYGLFDGIGNFNLLGFDSPLLIWITLCIFMISLVAVVPPLIRNVRRSPMKDMRDE